MNRVVKLELGAGLVQLSFRELGQSEQDLGSVGFGCEWEWQAIIGGVQQERGHWVKFKWTGIGYIEVEISRKELGVTEAGMGNKSSPRITSNYRSLL